MYINDMYLSVFTIAKIKMNQLDNSKIKILILI